MSAVLVNDVHSKLNETAVEGVAPVDSLESIGGGFLLNLCAFALFLELSVQYAAASVAAYLVSNAAMYLGNRYFTFGVAAGGFLAAYARYVAVGIVVALSAATLLALLVELAGVGPRLGQALALMALVPLSFLLSQRWVFSAERRGNQAAGT